MKKITSVIVLLFAIGCARGTTPPPQHEAAPVVQGDKIAFPPNAPQLKYVKIEPAPERNSVASGVNGRLVWDEDLTSKVYPAVSGRVVEIRASPGQRVAAGDVLARVESPEFGQAQAEARKALAGVRAAERALNRTRELFDHGAAAAKDVDEAEADYARAISEKERAVATLSVYGGNTSSGDGIFSVRSPIGGAIVERNVNPGQEIRSEQVGDKPLFLVTDPRRLWLYLDITEADVASLQAGQEVLIHARAVPGVTFRGRVEIVGEGLDPATRTIKARCLVDNTEKLLRAEMYVSADVTRRASGVDVPAKAIFLKDSQPFVFVETAPNAFAKQRVTVGVENNGRAVILSGLAAGQRVVTEGCLLLEAMLENANS